MGPDLELHMKVLAQTGVSLADVYDIQGSIVGTDELLGGEVHLSHEMGGTIFSERIQTFIVAISSGAILQSASFDATFGAIPDCPNRVLAVTVIVDTASRLNNCTLSVFIDDASGEYPIFNWAIAHDQQKNCRIDLGAAAPADLTMLVPIAGVNLLPALLTRVGIADQMPTLRFRGTTDAFGAGDVTATCLVTLARATPGSPAPGEPSSHGLPIPSW